MTILHSMIGITFTQSHTQLGLTGNEIITLAAWTAAPGWPAAIEAVQRGQRPDKCLNDVVLLLMIATESLFSILKAEDVIVVSGRTSLAATARKLIWPCLQLQTYNASADGREAPPPPLGAGNDSQEGMPEMFTVMRALLQCMLRLDDMISIIGSSCDLQCRMLIRGTGITLDQVQVGESKKPAYKNASSKLAASNYLQKLLFLKSLTLAQLFRFQLDWEKALETPPHEPLDWVAEFLGSLGGFHNQCLTDVLVTSLSIRQSQPEFSALWEAYASAHINGPLLPGCCNLGCTNTSGVSEGLLDTLLCSRCRKARYCCKECQRDAWLNGGHKTVCKQP